MKARVLAAATAVLALLSPSTVRAEKPQTTKSQFTLSFDNPGCGDFIAQVELNATLTQTTFFDAAGNPERLRLFHKFDGTITNRDNGTFLISRNPFIQTIDLQTGESTVVGLNFHLKVPNGPTVSIGAGRITFDANGNVIFSAGPQAFFESLPALPESVCSALR